MSRHWYIFLITRLLLRQHLEPNNCNPALVFETVQLREGIMNSFARSLGRTIVFLCIIALAPLGVAQGSDVVRETLNNGLRVVVVRNTLAPVVTTMVNYLVGSNEAPAGFPGTAHALEHMMFRGSPDLSASQLANLIAAMGGTFNADTQQTVTQYFFTVPSDDLDVALHIEAIRMQGALNTESLWQEERGAIEQEVAQDLSNPMYVFYSKLLSDMFAGTPYAHDPLGSRPSFDKTTGTMLEKFRKAWYVPNNAIMVIVGDVDPEKALELVKTYFADIPSQPLPPRPEINLQPLKATTSTLETDLSYGLAIVAYRLPGYGSPDYAAAQVLTDALDSQRGNLYALVPEGKALMAGFSGNFLPQSGFGYAVAAFPKGGDGSALVTDLKEVIAGYVEKGVPADLVEAEKRHEVADAEFEKNSVEGLASLWSEALAVEGRNSPNETIEAIKKVTGADVNRVAQAYLQNNTAIVGILTPRPAGMAAASQQFGGKESFAPKEVKSVSLPEWAKKVSEPPSMPTSNVHPTDVVLPNGLRVIVQPESISPTILLSGEMKNEPSLETPPGQEGVDTVLGELFSNGTTTLDRLAFQAAVDEIGANISAGMNFSLEVMSADFDRGVELLADNLLHPALPKDAFDVVRSEIAGMVAGLLQSPPYLQKRAMREGIFPENDPALRQPTPQSISSLTLADVQNYYQKVFRPDLTTIVIIGDVTPERAREVIEHYFGQWQAAGTKPETDLPPVPLNKASSEVVPDPSRVQNQVILAETVDMTRLHPDYYTLQVGNHVLSGAFYATRLYRDLREKAGLVYTVESFIDAGKTRSLFGVVYACDPVNVTKAKVMVEENLRMMQTTPVTPAELNQSKIILVKQIPLSEASTDSIADNLLTLSLLGLPLNERMTAARHYLDTTAAQVREAFRKWIRPDGFALVSLGPNPE